MRDRIDPAKLAELYAEQDRIKTEKAEKAAANNQRSDKYRSEYHKKTKPCKN